MTQRNVTHSRTVGHSRAPLARTARIHRLSLGEPVDTSFVPPETVPRAATANPTSADHSRRETGNTATTTGPGTPGLTLVTRLPYRTGRLPGYHADGRHRRVCRSPGGSG
ncbi:hypothetical protein SAMN04487820_11520 [Actinopolyspora mzabensis]|uniref:Uncharacterized protein n=1 Tax=Actinopolyspora mzabensis TaxID=995066 RepID=A0A1G9FGJ6_ACTMZ|nr:hypothetical protein [Actinopolyspora mzabensis]SDK87520.1 hypothetical protein SAMN04487820_11520 [Actinopolyspora mzabensis]